MSTRQKNYLNPTKNQNHAGSRMRDQTLTLHLQLSKSLQFEISALLKYNAA